jgi:putative DNA primase/helicase
LRAYQANRANVAESAFESNPIAVAIRSMITTDFPAGWDGTPTDLLKALDLRASESTRRLKLWPATAQAMGSAVDRVAPLLRQQGFNVIRQHSGVRTIFIGPKSA